MRVSAEELDLTPWADHIIMIMPGDATYNKMVSSVMEKDTRVDNLMVFEDHSGVFIGTQSEEHFVITFTSDDLLEDENLKALVFIALLKTGDKDKILNTELDALKKNKNEACN